MIIEFNDCVFTQVRRGTSKKGNDYAVLKFIFDYEQYEIFCTGNEVDKAMAQPMKRPVTALFELHADDRNAGVRLTLVHSIDAEGVCYGG